MESMVDRSAVTEVTVSGDGPGPITSLGNLMKQLVRTVVNNGEDRLVRLMIAHLWFE